MRITVNGATHDVMPSGRETLLALLRDRLSLTSPKLACGRGECGACTVLLQEPGADASEAVYACLTLATACEGHAVTTVEGLGRPGDLHALQQAFIDHDALQCGFCTPGQLLAAAALLARHPDPTAGDVHRGMSGNLCRCGTYPRIVDAVLTAARRIQDKRG